jgi:carbon storage regulator
MLVLARKVGETIVIDGHIRVHVVEVRGTQVRLAFEAPPEVRIDRSELHDRRLFPDVEAAAADL